MFTLGGENIFVVRKAITETQVRSYPLFYINILLIQSRGITVRTLCSTYYTQITAFANRWARPFFICTRLPGHFGGAYTNCKWRDHADRCSVRDGQEDESDNDDRPRQDLKAGSAGGGGWRI